jgi:hypothetical protein
LDTISFHHSYLYYDIAIKFGSYCYEPSGLISDDVTNTTHTHTIHLYAQTDLFAIDRMPNFHGLPVDITAVWTHRESNFSKRIAPLQTLTCELEYELLFTYLRCGISHRPSPQKDLQFGRPYHQKWRNCYSIVICERSVPLNIANP